jgi:DNAJ protein RME-8 N-terminal
MRWLKEAAAYTSSIRSAIFLSFFELLIIKPLSLKHPCLAIVRGAGLCMKALIEEGSAEVGAKMQQLALTEGALPRHLQSALYLRGPEPRILALRQLSRHLVALWCVDNEDANNLLKRILVNKLGLLCQNSVNI